MARPAWAHYGQQSVYHSGWLVSGQFLQTTKRGRRQSDADVAVSHAPAELGYCPLTLALVDAEATLSAALKGGFIAESAHDALLKAATGLHFSTRTWVRVLSETGLSEAESAHFLKYLPEFEQSLKRQDAQRLLTNLKRTSRLRRMMVRTVGKYRTPFFSSHLKKKFSAGDS